MTSKLRIFTVVWGDNHLNWFERACIKSLGWEKNREAIKDATWTIFTKKCDLERAKELVKRTGVKTIEFGELPESAEGNSPVMGAHLLQCLLTIMDASIKDGSKVLMAPPDTIFSDGTISALLIAGRQRGTCVAVPHPRVSPSIFGGIKDSPLSGEHLVSLAIKHGHKAWTEAEDGCTNQNSFIGGISWRRLAPKIIAVTHRLPTVYLAEFEPEDVVFFKSSHDGLPPTFGVYDHGWPSKLLGDQRQRVIGSSDAACVIEVTKEDLNVPPAHPVNPLEPDAYWRNKVHNIINRQYLYIMREA